MKNIQSFIKQSDDFQSIFNGLKEGLKNSCLPDYQAPSDLYLQPRYQTN